MIPAIFVGNMKGAEHKGLESKKLNMYNEING